MSYISYLYLFGFLIAAFVLYYIVPKKFRWAVLLAFSAAFYIISSKKLTVFLVASVFSIYIGGLILGKLQERYDEKCKLLEKDERKELKKTSQRDKRIIVACVLAFNFGVLLVLKYWNFLCGAADAVTALFGYNITCYPSKLFMPLGISFYTLQVASYIIDVYRGKYKPTKNLGKIALFLSFWPQITEGPIGRFDLLADQLYTGHSFDYDRISKSLQLILWGLFKKIVIADRAAMLIKTVFDNYLPETEIVNSYRGITIVVAALMYTLQLYAEFSGAIDVVRGSAGLFGVTLSENFKRPFFSQSINEFWRRWHITLGLWLKDYVFYSVSLSKTFMKLSQWTKKHFNKLFGNLVPAAFALFFVWFLNGFWHGSGIKYITYGLYYYVIMLFGMIFEPLFKKAFDKSGIKRDGKPMCLFRIFRTFILVNIGMMIFRAGSLSIFGSMVADTFKGGFFSQLSDGTLLNLGIDAYDYIVIAIGCVVMFVVGLLQEKGHDILNELAEKKLPVRWVVYIALILAVVVFGAYGEGYGVVDLIYGQF